MNGNTRDVFEFQKNIYFKSVSGTFIQKVSFSLFTLRGSSSAPLNSRLKPRHALNATYSRNLGTAVCLSDARFRGKLCDAQPRARNTAEIRSGVIPRKTTFLFPDRQNKVSGRSLLSGVSWFLDNLSFTQGETPQTWHRQVERSGNL